MVQSEIIHLNRAPSSKSALLYVVYFDHLVDVASTEYLAIFLIAFSQFEIIHLARSRLASDQSLKVCYDRMLANLDPHSTLLSLCKNNPAKYLSENG